MADRRQVARTLIIVGILLLPAPLYIGVVADNFFPAPRASYGYVAEPAVPDTTIAEQGPHYENLTTNEKQTVHEIDTAIAEQAPHYENLTANEKQTFDEILNASTDNSGYYVPRVNDPFVEKVPITVWKGDTLYRIDKSVSIYRGISQSEIESLVGFGLSVIGIILAVLGWRVRQSA